MKFFNRRKERMLKENRRVSEIMRLFEIKQADISPKMQTQVDKLTTALNAGDLEAVVKILNTDELKSKEGKDFLNAGDLDKDKVSVKADSPKMACNQMKPTQSQIFCSQSIAFPLSNWATLVDAAAGKFFGGISIAKADSGYLVLDGHHRWSGAMSISNDAAFKATVYEFKGLSQEEILSRLQIGVATQTPTGNDLPSATGPELDTATGTAGESKSPKKTITGGGDPDDILGRDANFIANRISKLCGNENSDAKIQANGGDPVFMGDQFFKKMTNNPDAGALALIGLVTTDLGTQKPAAEIAGNGLECPVRKKIIEKIAGNMAKLPSNDSAPEREFMPQLDHVSLVKGEKSKDDIESGFLSGKINHEEPYFEKEIKAESIDLRRWNKLAGLLKD